MKRIIFLFLASPLIAFSQLFSDFLPSSNGELVSHNYYSISYSEQHEQAEWVFYEIKKEFWAWLAEQMTLEWIRK